MPTNEHPVAASWLLSAELTKRQWKALAVRVGSTVRVVLVTGAATGAPTRVILHEPELDEGLERWIVRLAAYVGDGPAIVVGSTSRDRTLTGSLRIDAAMEIASAIASSGAQFVRLAEDDGALALALDAEGLEQPRLAA